MAPLPLRAVWACPCRALWRLGFLLSRPAGRAARRPARRLATMKKRGIKEVRGGNLDGLARRGNLAGRRNSQVAGEARSLRYALPICQPDDRHVQASLRSAATHAMLAAD